MPMERLQKKLYSSFSVLHLHRQWYPHLRLHRHRLCQWSQWHQPLDSRILRPVLHSWSKHHVVIYKRRQSRDIPCLRQPIYMFFRSDQSKNLVEIIGEQLFSLWLSKRQSIVLHSSYSINHHSRISAVSERSTFLCIPIWRACEISSSLRQKENRYEFEYRYLMDNTRRSALGSDFDPVKNRCVFCVACLRSYQHSKLLVSVRPIDCRHRDIGSSSCNRLDQAIGHLSVLRKHLLVLEKPHCDRFRRL